MPRTDCLSQDCQGNKCSGVRSTKVSLVSLGAEAPFLRPMLCCFDHIRSPAAAEDQHGESWAAPGLILPCPASAGTEVAEKDRQDIQRLRARSGAETTPVGTRPSLESGLARSRSSTPVRAPSPNRTEGALEEFAVGLAEALGDGRGS